MECKIITRLLILLIVLMASCCQGGDSLHRSPGDVEEYRSTVGVWEEVSGQDGVQEIDPDEHANQQEGPSVLHHNSLRSHQRQSEDQREGERGDGPGGPGAAGDHHEGL